MLCGDLKWEGNPKKEGICVSVIPRLWVLKNTLAMQAMQETWVWSLGWEDLLEKEIAVHSSILVEESHGQRSLVSQSMGSQSWIWLNVAPLNSEPQGTGAENGYKQAHEKAWKGESTSLDGRRKAPLSPLRMGLVAATQPTQRAAHLQASFPSLFPISLPQRQRSLMWKTGSELVLLGKKRHHFPPVCVDVEKAEGTRMDLGTKVCRFY